TASAPRPSRPAESKRAVQEAPCLGGDPASITAETLVASVCGHLSGPRKETFMASSRFVVLPASLCLAWGLVLRVPSSARAEAKSTSKSKAARVDINSARGAELEAWPGVGAATAEKIIAGRPYASVADLEKAGVSTKTIEQIKPLVTAKKPKGTAKTKAEKP